MKLFTVGPVEMYKETLKISAKQLPYFRTPEFSKIMIEVKRKLMKLLNCDGDLAILTCSGTGGLEAAVMNSANKKDKCLVINGGTFGKRFCDILSIHKIQFNEIIIPFGEELKAHHLAEYSNKGYTKLFVQACETSTGQLYDLKMIGEFCKKNNIALIVDAISSFLADEINMKKMNIDLVVIGSQKELALAPGLSVIAVSKKMKTYISNNSIESLYFNLNNYFINMKRGQPPFTTAVGIVLQMHERLKHIDLKKEINKHKKRASYFRKQAQKIGLQIPSYPLSNGLTPVNS